MYKLKKQMVSSFVKIICFASGLLAGVVLRINCSAWSNLTSIVLLPTTKGHYKEILGLRLSYYFLFTVILKLGRHDRHIFAMLVKNA